MVKLCSMVGNADKSGVDSTSANDMRITSVGKIIRKCKLDELTQIWNVLLGDMSFVGPRPNVQREVVLYTDEERHLLDVRPGITDLSSIVFFDDRGMLADKDDSDLQYDQLIRPWKSRLGLPCTEKQSLGVDIQLIVLTIVAIFHGQKLSLVSRDCWYYIRGDHELLAVSRRNCKLYAYALP